jgi:hypothetical protein
LFLDYEKRVRVLSHFVAFRPPTEFARARNAEFLLSPYSAPSARPDFHHAKRGASAEAEVRENAKYTMDSVLRSNFAGGRIRKTETDFFEKFFGLGLPPRRRVREECGADFFFWRAGIKKIYL